MEIWIADLRGLAPTSLFRCSCRRWRRRCTYHRADWPFLLGVVLEEFQAEYGEGRADLRQARETLAPKIESRLRGRRRRRELSFAWSLFIDPMLATSEHWTNGQHRCQAALDAGCHQTLFGG
jgi:hypothetical protein